MKKAKGRDEENFKNPKNDILILQWANTALGNRLDHYKRYIEQKKQGENIYKSICECYEFFFTSYFAGWKNFLIKLERLNLLVKRQDSTERQTSKFKQLFESMGEMVQVMNKLKECVEKATKEVSQPIVNNANNGTNTQSNNAINKQRNLTNAAALSDLQKITKTRVESFLKNFENIYTEVAIDCATYGQRMNDAVRSLAQNNDANDTMRRLYRENSQLQTKIKEQETYLSRSASLADTEKDFIMNYFGNQNRLYEELQQRFSEERELSERLSLRIRQKMDYCISSITAKTGQQDTASILAKVLQNSSQQLQTQKETTPQQQNTNSGNMEIEDNGTSTNAVQATEKTEEKEGYECICGGYQTEYFCQKYEETLKKLVETQQELIANQSIMTSTVNNMIGSNGLTNIGTATQNAVSTLQGSSSLLNNMSQEGGSSSQNNQNMSLGPSMSMDACLNDGKNSCGSIDNSNLSNATNGAQNSQIATLKRSESFSVQQQQNISQQSHGQNLPLQGQTTTMSSGDEICDAKLRLSFAEKIVILQKQNDQIIAEKLELEKIIREMELEQKNQEDKFFRSGAYQSLAIQTEELLKSTIILRNQLKEAKISISDIEKLRFREMQDTVLKFKEEKENLMRQVQEAREGVYKNQLGEIMRENLSQHFDYKKYTQPLQDQLEKTSESLTIQREHCQNLEEQKAALQTQIQSQQKTISDLQTKLSEKEQYILFLESKAETTSESYVDEKNFKYPKHKETLKYIEKLLADLQNAGQVNQDTCKNFKEVVVYIKSREEKVSMIESKLKISETDRKKLQQNQDQIWKDYESLENSFTKLKQRCDQQMLELKNHAEREQELECKNLEIQMQFQKEKQVYTIMMAAEQQKKDTTKAFIEGLDEQNKQLIQQNANLNALNEESALLNQQIRQELEDLNIQYLDIHQRHELLTKKHNDTQEAYNELICSHERIQAKLQAAYDVLENNESKNTSTEVASLKEKLQNMRLLLQCSCGENIKDTILQKCLHPFCRQCIEKQIRLRQRTCPKCRTAFGQNDVKKLYLSH